MLQASSIYYVVQWGVPDSGGAGAAGARTCWGEEGGGAKMDACRTHTNDPKLGLTLCVWVWVWVCVCHALMLIAQILVFCCGHFSLQCWLHSAHSVHLLSTCLLALSPTANLGCISGPTMNRCIYGAL